MNARLAESGWVERRLKFVAKLTAGQSADGAAVNDIEDGLPFLQGCAEFGEKSPRADRYCIDPPKVAPAGSWLVSVRAPVGRTNKADRQYGIGRGLAAVEAAGIDAAFLGYVLEDSAANLNSLATGSTFLAVSAPQLGSLEIPVPPLETQKQIAAFLDEKTAQIDALIARKHALLERLAEKRQAIITQAVTKGLNLAAPMKDSGIDWLGQISAHWEIKRLKYISPRVTVGIVVTPAAYYADEGTLALRGLNVKTMGFDLSDIRYITDDGHALNRKSELREGDLVAVRTGAPGTTAIVSRELAGCNCIDLVIIRRPSNADPRYIGWFLNSDIAKTQYAMGAEGALQQHFNVETSKEMVISLPPKGEQREIAAYIDAAITAHDRQHAMVDESISKLVEYRAALITSAVTGQIAALQ